MRLSDEIAATRRIYTHDADGIPVIVLIDIPPRFSGKGLALGRYYPVITETTDELRELEAFLSADRHEAMQPNLLDRRASDRNVEALTLAEYAPPDLGWPWVLLCQWPDHIARDIESEAHLMARGAYTIEVYATRHELRQMAEDIRHTLNGDMAVELVTHTSSGD